MPVHSPSHAPSIFPSDRPVVCLSFGRAVISTNGVGESRVPPHRPLRSSTCSDRPMTPTFPNNMTPDNPLTTPSAEGFQLRRRRIFHRCHRPMLPRVFLARCPAICHPWCHRPCQRCSAACPRRNDKSMIEYHQYDVCARPSAAMAGIQQWFVDVSARGFSTPIGPNVAWRAVRLVPSHCRCNWTISTFHVLRRCPPKWPRRHIWSN
jgi:hypothetical protein